MILYDFVKNFAVADFSTFVGKLEKRLVEADEAQDLS